MSDAAVDAVPRWRAAALAITGVLTLFLFGMRWLAPVLESIPVSFRIRNASPQEILVATYRESGGAWVPRLADSRPRRFSRTVAPLSESTVVIDAEGDGDVAFVVVGAGRREAWIVSPWTDLVIEFGDRRKRPDRSLRLGFHRNLVVLGVLPLAAFVLASMRLWRWRSPDTGLSRSMPALVAIASGWMLFDLSRALFMMR